MLVFTHTIPRCTSSFTLISQQHVATIIISMYVQNIKTYQAHQHNINTADHFLQWLVTAFRMQLPLWMQLLFRTQLLRVALTSTI